jgi:non-specific serine/threonine protein kinase
MFHTHPLSPVSHLSPSAPLTSRQREVATLIAHGLTNRQIAERLIIAPRTADNHVQHIFDKLGLTARAQVAAWIAVRGLLTAA